MLKNTSNIISLILFIIVSFHTAMCFGDNSLVSVSLAYNQNKSLAVNEKNFLSNMKRDCKNYGYELTSGAKSPRDILTTYPTEIAYLIFKKHLNNLCYYSASHIVKYLVSDFKDQVQALFTSAVEKCFTETKELKPLFCRDFTTQAPLYDATVVLGSFCNTKSLKTFKKVNCHFKYLGEKKCSMYEDAGKPLKKCPFYLTNIQQSNDLHKSFYGKRCKRLRWRKPACLR